MVLQQIKHNGNNNLFASYHKLCDRSTFKFVVGKKIWLEIFVHESFLWDGWKEVV
jgi:hypothetical protein